MNGDKEEKPSKRKAFKGGIMEDRIFDLVNSRCMEWDTRVEREKL